MNDPSDNRRPASAFLHLSSFGLVAAAIVVSFGMATFSFLGASKEVPTKARTPEFANTPSAVIPYAEADKETQTGSGIGESAIGFIYTRSIAVPDTVGRDHREETPPAESQGLLKAIGSVGSSPETPLVSPSERLGAESRAEPVRDPEATAAIRETKVASPNSQALPIEEMATPKRDDVQQPAAQSLEISNSVSTSPNTSGTTVPVASTSDQAADRLFREFKIERQQAASLDQPKVAAHETPAHLHNGGSNGHVADPNAGFRFRVRRECGPITDPELRRHCVASFSTIYR